jgi:hypothetical protein
MEDQDVSKISKFSNSYQVLAAESVLICRTDDGQAEVWETRHDLLTVVDFKKVDFWTHRRDVDPVQYEGARQEFLKEKILTARQQVFLMTPAKAFQQYEKGDQAYALALVENHLEYFKEWQRERMDWAEKAAGTTCMMENCGRALYARTDDPVKFCCPTCGSTYSSFGFLEFVRARKGTAFNALKENTAEMAQVRKDMQKLAVRLQQLKIERKILAKHAKDWGVC